ncbi:MAG: hypothetical protein V4702_02950 [Patescibacteria group bacterium]
MDRGARIEEYYRHVETRADQVANDLLRVTEEACRVGGLTPDEALAFYEECLASVIDSDPELAQQPPILDPQTNEPAAISRRVIGNE